MQGQNQENSQVDANEGVNEPGPIDAPLETSDSHYPPPPAHWAEFAPKQDSTEPPYQPPDISFIQEQGFYEAFGEQWPLQEVPFSLQEAGIEQLYPEGLDRKKSLQNLLHTLIYSYIQLVRILMNPPPNPKEQQEQEQQKQENGEQSIPQVEQVVNHIRTTGINIHHLLNSLRPVQARETLKLLLEAQIDRRRQRVQELKRECDENKALVANIKEKYKDAFEWLQKSSSKEGSVPMDEDTKAESDSQQNHEEKLEEESNSNL